MASSVSGFGVRGHMLLRTHRRLLLLTETCQVGRLATAARRARFQRTQVLRFNRRDPTLEKAARLQQLRVPLGEVQEEWLASFKGQQQLQEVARHFALDRDVFGGSPQCQSLMTVVYGTSSPVQFGNVLRPAQAQERPAVVLPEPRGYWTLTLTSPDNGLAGKGQELLHWMIVNMTASNISSGQERVMYLPPLPLKGTGLHRFVFTLFSHHQELCEVPLPAGTWLERRSHSTRHFLRSNGPNPLQVESFRFFQAAWDESVRGVFSEQLDHPEPEYDLRVT